MDYKQSEREKLLNIIPEEKPYIIKNLDKDWFFLITSIKGMEKDNALVMLNEMYKHIPLLFGFPEKVVNKDTGNLVKNPDWLDARNWIDYHAGWVIIDNVLHIHPIRRLEEKFSLNGNLDW